MTARRETCALWWSASGRRQRRGLGTSSFSRFVVVGEPRDADVLEVSVGDVFSHFLGPDAKKTFLVEIIVRVLSGLHRRVHELLHGGTNDFVGNLVVGVAEFLEGRLPVAADLVVVLVLLDTKGRG